MDVFSLIEKMSQDGNQELKMAPLSNIKSAQSGKDGWGSITIAVPNEMINNLVIDTEYYIGGLLLVKRTEFEKYKY